MRSLRDEAGEAAAMLGLGDDDLGVARHGRVAVHEVGGRTVGQALEHGVLALDLEAVPADVGQARGIGDDLDVAFEQTQHLGAILVAGLEEQLQAQAHTHEPGASHGRAR